MFVLGKNVILHSTAKLVNQDHIEIGDGTMIDDFTFINGGRSCRIGKYNHIEMFSSITGGGEFSSEDNVVLGPGARVLTATDTYQSGMHMSTAMPESERDVVRSFVKLGRDSFIGTNSVVHPGVTIGEGAIVGSMSLVTHDVEPWTINHGVPCRKVGMRPEIRRVSL